MSRKKSPSGARRCQTPVQAALESSSCLVEHVQAGLGAIEKSHRVLIAEDVKIQIDESLDLDAAIQPNFPNDNRWDYLLGHNGKVLGLEPHSAKDDQVSTVISKRIAAKDHLKSHLKPGSRVHAWFWVASNRVEFANTERTTRRLDESGICFVGKQLKAKHIKDD